ncbi:hypothetical protein NM165_0273, partial [Neisseria meningitidis NM165]
YIVLFLAAVLAVVAYNMYQENQYRKKAAKSKKTVMFAGREYGISKQNLSDVWDDFEDAMELKAFPCLSSLFLTKWHKNLYDSGLTKTSTALSRLSSKRTIL